MLPAPRPTRETERVCGTCFVTFEADFPCTGPDGVEDACADCCVECSSDDPGHFGAAS